MNLKQLLMLLGLVRPEKILYIGGSDVLPPPLPPEEERTLIARLAEGALRVLHGQQEAAQY